MEIMIELDLHGMTYDTVRLKVEEFIYTNEPPYVIVTGNSTKMQDVVREVLKEYDLEGHYMGNLGSLTVTEKC